jgi:hypothetical protein
VITVAEERALSDRESFVDGRERVGPVAVLAGAESVGSADVRGRLPVRDALMDVKLAMAGDRGLAGG